LSFPADPNVLWVCSFQKLVLKTC